MFLVGYFEGSVDGTAEAGQHGLRLYPTRAGPTFRNDVDNSERKACCRVVEPGSDYLDLDRRRAIRNPTPLDVNEFVRWMAVNVRGN